MTPDEADAALIAHFGGLAKVYAGPCRYLVRRDGTRVFQQAFYTEPAELAGAPLFWLDIPEKVET